MEGHGEVEAVPTLCYKILLSLGISGWQVDEQPVRLPRSVLVDERVSSPHRPCLRSGIARAVSLALGRRANGVLVLCDSDDDCAATWATDFAATVTAVVPVAPVMAVREYEAWLLANQPAAIRVALGIVSPETIRDAKGRLKKARGRYLPTVHQLALTRGIDVASTRRACPSFDKLVRTVASLCS